MNILLINSNLHHKHGLIAQLLYKLNSNPILVLQQIAAATPKEHSLKLIDDKYDKPHYNGEVDLVGISAVTSSAPRAYRIADTYREKGIPVVIGGIHASALPEEAKHHADSVVIGEAERSWPQLIKDFESGHLKPFYKSDKPANSNLIKCPRHDLLRVPPLFTAVAPSRGCPFNCSFCTLTHLHGQIYRPRPIENVIQEINNTSRKFLVFLHDSALTINKKYAKALFKAMIPLKRKFIAYGTLPSLLDDDELLILANKAGCIVWCLGFETICHDSLKNDANKAYSIDKYESVCRRIHKFQMNVFGSFAFGFDNDEPTVFDNTLQAAYDFGLDGAEFNILTPFPSTRLFHKLNNEGRILTKDWKKYDLRHVVFQPKKMTVEELYDGITNISLKYYSPLKTIQRILDVTINTRKFSNILIMGAMNSVMLRFHGEFSPD